MSQFVKPNPRQVVRLETAADLLGLSGDDIVGLIDSGHIVFAWNISSPTARCREIRILAEALAAHRENRACRVNTLDEAIGMVLPKPSSISGAPTIRRSILSRRLGCSCDHLANLTASGEIKLASVRVSKSESPLLTHASVSHWLHRRALGRIAYKAALKNL